MKSYNIISLDLETTGLSTTKAEIIQLGIAVSIWDLDSVQKTITQQTLLPSFCKYVQPDQVAEIDSRVIEITGITQAKLKENKAKKFKEVFHTLKLHLDNICGDLPRVLISYNGNRFDIPIFCSTMARCFTEPFLELRKLKLTNNFDLLPCVRGEMDTTCLLRKKNGRVSYTLGDVYKAITGHKLQGAHDALVDCLSLFECINRKEINQILAMDLSCNQISSCKYGINPMVIFKKYIDSYQMNQNRKVEKGQRTIEDMFYNASKKKMKC